jgi:hypothetical protein
MFLEWSVLMVKNLTSHHQHISSLMTINDGWMKGRCLDLNICILWNLKPQVAVEVLKLLVKNSMLTKEEAILFSSI